MNNDVKIVLIEDESYNLLLIRDMIKKIRPGWEVVNTMESVRESVNWLRSHPSPDLLFMDIQLTDGLCFSIFDQVEVNSLVIFTTAYDNYAIRAFKVNSIDYLLKPFREKDLEAAIEKFENFSKLSSGADDKKDYSDILDAIRKGEKKYRKRFLVSKGPAYYTLQVDEIAFFISENRITTAVSLNKQNHVLEFSLEALEEQLKPDDFFRINRQIIVNIQVINRIENYFGGKLKVRLSPPFNNELVISRLRAMPFKRWAGR